MGDDEQEHIEALYNDLKYFEHYPHLANGLPKDADDYDPELESYNCSFS